MSFRVQVGFGREKYNIEVPADDIKFEEFQTKVSEVTGVPNSSQKLIFKGRTLQDESKTLRELRIGSNSKMLLLSKKDSLAEDPTSLEIEVIVKAVDKVEHKISEVEEEINGIEKGYIPTDKVDDACRGIHKRCVTCSELLMQNTEKLDAIDVPVPEVMIRTRRKTVIQRIQRLLSRNDTLVARVDQCRKNPQQ